MPRKHARIVENSRFTGRNDISFDIGHIRNFLQIFENVYHENLENRRKFLLSPLTKLMSFLSKNRPFSTILARFQAIWHDF